MDSFRDLLDALQLEFARQANLLWVIGATALLSLSSALVGCFAFLRKNALAGDAVAHAVLPGICLSFLVTGTKDPVALLIGAFVTGWLGIASVQWLQRFSRLKEDASIAVVLSVFFGVGILLLTAIQQQGNASQTGLDTFLFGKAAALVGEDVQVFGGLAVVLILAVLLGYKEFKLLSFDPAYGHSLGLPMGALQVVLNSLTVLAVVVGIQAVGVVLMAAMLITPAAAARFWTHRLPTMMWLAGTFGMLSGLGGAVLSFLVPGLPTGPCMVIMATGIAMISFTLAPQQGVLAKLRSQRRLQRRIRKENLLKALYQLDEQAGPMGTTHPLTRLVEHRSFNTRLLEKTLKQLISEGLAVQESEGIRLTEAGTQAGKRMVRLHRLWELYLTTQLNLAPDHVHDDAENVEHILTPELEARLEHLLEYPDMDPHGERIPR